MVKMAKYDLYSKRLNAAAGPVEVFQYDRLPEEFRNQVFSIWRDTIGFVAWPIAAFSYQGYDIGEKLTLRVFNQIGETLCREYGLLSVGDGATSCISVFEFSEWLIRISPSMSSNFRLDWC